MTSPAEYEAALRQLEQDPPEIHQYNANIREERCTHFSLEGVNFPAATVDVIQRGEALAIFERDLIVHFREGFCCSSSGDQSPPPYRSFQSKQNQDIWRSTVRTAPSSSKPQQRSSFWKREIADLWSTDRYRLRQELHHQLNQ